jgi:hypothetical protein
MRRGLVLVAVLIVLGTIGSAAAGKPSGGAGQGQPAAPAGSKPTAPEPQAAISNREAQAAQEEGCPAEKVRQIDTDHAHELANPPSTPISFVVHESSSVVNFGTKRGTRADYVVLTASEAIPPNVYSTDFEMDSIEPMRRIGEAGLESNHLPAPTYTPPHFFNHRKEVGFNLCIPSGSSGEDAGTYTGVYDLVGPGSIETATVTQTAQLKAGKGTFWAWFGIVVFFALVLLVMNHLVLPAKPTSPKEWVARIVVILFSLAAAAAAMLVAWSQNATWGENIWVAIGALIATAFAAAGVGSTLSAAAARIEGPGADSR